jgi:inositol 1,4,5-triphosphate receptor type 3
MSQVQENFCTSSLQCYLFMIDYGMRSGGGIGDVLPKISYRENSTFFVGHFFYNIIFHIFIILILGNIFLGIIVDTFADLRDKNEAKIEDMENICFICQMSQDQSLKQKIDFKEHVDEDHYVWNYVYFLTHLHIMNQADFNPLQQYVWNCLVQNNISWIPIYRDE